MVGLLSAMENEDRSSASVVQKDKDGDVGAAQAEESIDQKPSAEDGQPAVENTYKVDEVEHVKELKSILKQRGQYTFRKVKVDFDLIPKKIPYDEDDYTVEIKIVEKEPVKIKSWAALFAAKKAEAEAEAAAIAEAEEALKKAEEVQKREALKKANKAKLKKGDDHSTSSQEADATLSAEPNENIPAPKGNLLQNQVETEDKTVEHTEPGSCRQSVNKSLPTEHDEYEKSREKTNERVETNSDDQPTETELRSPREDYQLAESVVNDVVDGVIISEDPLSNSNPHCHLDDESVSEQRDDEEISCSESMEAERSEQLQEDQTNEGISTHEEASVSQLADDSQTEQSLSQALHTRSDLEEKLSDDDASVSQAEDNSPKIIHSEDSSKAVDLQGKKVPKKILVTASSLVEEILSETPFIIQAEQQDHGKCKASITTSNENDGTGELQLQPGITLESTDLKLEIDTKTKNVNDTRAQRKRREFRKDSKIFEHVKRSLESAAPEVLQTAMSVLEDIEKIVVDKVGSAVL